jgi:hypothetical protein
MNAPRMSKSELMFRFFRAVFVVLVLIGVAFSSVFIGRLFERAFS